MGITEPFSNKEILVVLTSNSLDFFYIHKDKLEHIISNHINDIDKMLVEGNNIYLKNKNQLSHFELHVNKGILEISKNPGIGNDPLIQTDFNEICILEMNQSKIFLSFPSLIINNTKTDLIKLQVVSGHLDLKQNGIAINLGSTTCFTKLKENGSLFTGNFLGQIKKWSMIDVGEGFELILLEENTIPNKLFNFMRLTKGEKTLILGTQTGNVTIFEHNQRYILFELNFDSEIHHIFEDVDKYCRLNLRVVSKDHEFIIKTKVENAITKMIYTFNQKDIQQTEH